MGVAETPAERVAAVVLNKVAAELVAVAHLQENPEVAVANKAAEAPEAAEAETVVSQTAG